MIRKHSCARAKPNKMNTTIHERARRDVHRHRGDYLVRVLDLLVCCQAEPFELVSLNRLVVIISHSYSFNPVLSRSLFDCDRRVTHNHHLLFLDEWLVVCGHQVIIIPDHLDQFLAALDEIIVVSTGKVSGNPTRVVVVTRVQVPSFPV